MKRSVTCFILFALLLSTLPSLASAGEKSPAPGEIRLTVIEDSPGELLLHFEAPPPLFTSEGVPIYPGVVSTAPEGYPLLPHISRFLTVGEGRVRLKVHLLRWGEASAGEIPPSPPPCPDMEEVFREGMKGDVYGRDDFYPGRWAEILEEGHFREYHLVLLRINPIQYNPVRGVVRYALEMSIEVISSPALPPPPAHPDISLFLKGVSFNWPWNFEGSPPPPLSSGAEYLIITHPSLMPAAFKMACWKAKEGYTVKVVNTTETGCSALSIRRYLERAYGEWNPPPLYILLLGDADLVPTNYFYRHPYHGTLTGTDHWYSTLSGTDYIPDVFIGRIPANNLTEAFYIVNKTISYRTSPPSNPGFYRNVTVAAYFQDSNRDGYEDRRFVKTSEEIRDNLTAFNYSVRRIYYTPSYVNPTHYNDGYFASGEPLPPSLLRSNGFAWDGDEGDITDAVMSGTLILNHRDHGARWGWGDPRYTSDDAYSLRNGNLTPVVFSINCQTGWFDHETDPYSSTVDECFSEDFLRAPGGGAVGVFGASRVSYSGYNDFLTLGFYDALFPSLNPGVGGNISLNRMGEVLSYGKMYMLETWGDSWGLGRLEFELFHFFGDPSLSIWLSEPKAADASPLTPAPSGTRLIHVNSSSEGATVTVTRGSHLYGRSIVAGGWANITVPPLTEGLYNVTVTGEEYIPLTVTFQVRGGEASPKPHLEVPAGAVRGEVEVAGVAQQRLEYTLLEEDFEGPGDVLYSTWDEDPLEGEDCWGVVTDPTGYGAALWCTGRGGRDEVELFRESFDNLSNWTTISHGPYLSPWEVSGGVLRCSGGVREMLEEVRLSRPINISSFEHFRLRFYLNYTFGDGGEYFAVLLSPDNTTWVEAEVLREGYTGELSVEFERGGWDEVYIALAYHATYDQSVVVDDLSLWGGRKNSELKRTPPGVHSVFRLPLDLSLYDSAVVDCSYRTGENTTLLLGYEEGTFRPLKGVYGSGASRERFVIPASAEAVLFVYIGGGDEGAYLEWISVAGSLELKKLLLRVDGKALAELKGDVFRFRLNTTALSDGWHNITLTAYYSEWLLASTSSMILVDNTPPEIGPPLTAVVGQGEVCEIGSYVEDEWGIEEVFLEVDGEHLPIAPHDGVCTVRWSTTEVGLHPYRVVAVDVAGNVAERIGWVNVTDTTPPRIHLSYRNIIQGEVWVLTAHVEDETGVERVWVSIGGEEYNLTGGPLYTFSKLFTHPGVFSFEVSARDPEGNIAREEGVFLVVDVTPPSFSLPERIEIVEDTEEILNLTVVEDSEVTEVRATLEGMPVQVEVGEVIRLHFMIERPGEYTLQVWVSDSWGNTGTGWAEVTVRDVTPPEAVIEGPEEVEYLSCALYRAKGRDDGGIESYFWRVSGPGGELEAEGELLRVEFTAPGQWVINLTAVDTSCLKSSVSIKVLCTDTTPPVPVIIWQSGVIYEGQSVNFSSESSFDNLGILNFTWTFQGDTNATILYGRAVTFNFSAPGVWRVTLVCVDVSGNEAATTLTLRVREKPHMIEPQVGKSETGEEGGGFYLLLSAVPYVFALLLLLLFRRRDVVKSEVEE